jgi:hypothetical protein
LEDIWNVAMGRFFCEVLDLCDGYPPSAPEKVNGLSDFMIMIPKRRSKVKVISRPLTIPVISDDAVSIHSCRRSVNEFRTNGLVDRELTQYSRLNSIICQHIRKSRDRACNRKGRSRLTGDRSMTRFSANGAVWRYQKDPHLCCLEAGFASSGTARSFGCQVSQR